MGLPSRLRAGDGESDGAASRATVTVFIAVERRERAHFPGCLSFCQTKVTGGDVLLLLGMLLRPERESRWSMKKGPAKGEREREGGE